nr:hypothetical protein [Tanacetum cinerariifolium]
MFICIGRFVVAYISELKKLKQVASVKEYYESYIDILNRLQRPQECSLSCFIDGLKEDIRCMVMLFKPQTIHEAYCFAMLQEATLEARKLKELIRTTSLPTQNRPQEEYPQELKRSVECYAINIDLQAPLRSDAHTRIHTRDQYKEILNVENGMGGKALMENDDENNVDATMRTDNEDVKDIQDVNYNKENEELELK